MNKKAKIVHNGQIDFWRFFGISMIVLGHANKLVAEPPLENVFAIWVDFFFILTGFFMASSIARAKTPCDMNTLGSETIAFTLKKIKSFYLIFLFSCVTALCAKVVLYSFDEVFCTWKIFGSVNDLLMTYATGIPSMSMTVGQWYLSAMVLAILIIYPIARRYPNLFNNVIALLAGIFLYGIMLHNEGVLTDPGTWYGIGMKGIVRAIGGISLGCVCHSVVAACKAAPSLSGRFGITVITALDIFAIPFAVYLMIKGIDPKYSSAVVFLLFVGVVTSMSGKSLFTKLFSNHFCVFLGKLSLPVFLCQGTIIYLIKAWQNQNPAFESYCNSDKGMPVMLAMLLIGTIILALVCLFSCRLMTAVTEKFTARWHKNP